MPKSNSTQSSKKLQAVAHVRGGVVSHITLHGQNIQIEAFVMDHDDASQGPIDESLHRSLEPMGSTKFKPVSAEEHIREIYRDDYEYMAPRPKQGKRRK